MRDERRRTREDRATQPLDAGRLSFAIIANDMLPKKSGNPFQKELKPDEMLPEKILPRRKYCQSICELHQRYKE